MLLNDLLFVNFFDNSIAASCGCHESTAASCGLSMITLPVSCGFPTKFYQYPLVMSGDVHLHHISSSIITNRYIKVPVWKKKYNSHIQYYNTYRWQDITGKDRRFVKNIFSNLFQVNDTTECCRECYSMICCLSIFWQFYSCLMWMSWVCSSLMWTIYDQLTSLMWISHSFYLISISYVWQRPSTLHFII